MKYIFEVDLPIEEIHQRIQNNTAERFYKTMKVPEMDNPNLRLVVGSNFEKEVLGSEKHTLLILCNYGISECQEVVNYFLTLNEQIKEPWLQIRIFDPLNNEHKKLEVKKVPGLLLFKPGVEVPVEYEGKKENIVEFLSKESQRRIELVVKEEQEEL